MGLGVDPTSRPWCGDLLRPEQDACAKKNADIKDEECLWDSAPVCLRVAVFHRHGCPGRVIQLLS